MTRSLQAICTIAARENGKEQQLRMLQEECGELIVATNHYLRARINHEPLIEEIADVTILLMQMEYFFGEKDIRDAVTRKLERLEKRMGAV